MYHMIIHNGCTYDTQIDNAKSDITSKIDIYKNVVPNV